MKKPLKLENVDINFWGAPEERKTIRGYKVNAAVAVHRSVNRGKKSRWTVTHLQSGCAIFDGVRSREAAFEAVRMLGRATKRIRLKLAASFK
jgi:hypothetical protein